MFKNQICTDDNTDEKNNKYEEVMGSIWLKTHNDNNNNNDSSDIFLRIKINFKMIMIKLT